MVMGNGWVVVVVVVGGGRSPKSNKCEQGGKGRVPKSWSFCENVIIESHHAFRQATPFFEN